MRTLSDKKVKLDMCDCDKEAYWEEDIKESIKKLKEEIVNDDLYNGVRIKQMIDKHIGRELT